MEWISPAIFHTLWCIRPWNSHNISSLLPETEARGTARAMFSLNESRRRSPYSSHGALVQHSLSELVLGQHILIPKTVLSVKILSFWCFWVFFLPKVWNGKGKERKGEGRKESKLCKFWKGLCRACNTAILRQWSSSASPVVLCTFVWSPDFLSICLYVPDKCCTGDSWHTHTTYLSILAAVIREWGSSESGSKAFYNVYVPMCLSEITEPAQLQLCAQSP